MSGSGLDALTGQYGNGLLPQDPAYLPAMQRLALARSLIGAGISDAPARPTQGIGRIAQALLGTYEMNRGNQAVQDTMAQRQQAAMSAYNTAMSPLGAALSGQTPPAATSITPTAPVGGAAAPTAIPSAAAPVAAAPVAPTVVPNLAATIAQHESGGQPGATNPLFPVSRGGPLGPQQFTADTWNGFAKANPALFAGMSPDQVLAARSNTDLSNKATNWLAGQNAPVLQSAGVTPTAATLSDAHALGGAGAAGVLKLPDDTTVAQALRQTQPDHADAILAQNPQYQSMTVGQLRAGGPWAPGSGGAAPGPAPGAAPAAAPAAATAPQVGLNNPNIMRAFQMHQAALKMVLADPYNMQTRQLAQGLEQTSSMLMGLDTFSNGPNGTQVNNRTGEIKYPPVGRVATDSAGNLMSLDANGPHVISPANVPGAAALAGAKAGAEATAKDQWQSATIGGVPGQQNTVTGEFRPIQPLPHYIQTPTGFVDTSLTHPGVYAPTPRPYTDVHGNTGAIGSGGQITPIADNPSGVSGNSPEANAMRTVSEIGPLIQNRTATPQQKANYATAVESYQQPVIHADPATGALVRLNTRELPSGYPAPPAFGPAGATTAPLPGQSPSATQLTGGSRGPAAAQAITEDQAKNDAAEISKEQAATMQSHNMLGTTATIRAVAPQVTTGTGADARLRLAQVFTGLGVDPKEVQQWVGTNAAPGEIMQKKLFELSTGATRAMGAREPGSVMMMFQKNYPNLSSRNMTIDSMTRLLDMDQVYKEDEIGGRQQYLGQQIQGVAAGKPYGGLSGYQQPDPRLYQGAALAAGGMPYSVWTQGLQPPQQTAALKLAARVYPDASALDAQGNRHVFQPPPPPPQPQGAPGG